MEDISSISAIIGHIGSLHGSHRSGRARKYSFQKIQEIEAELAYIEDRFRAKTVKGKKRISIELRREQLIQELVELQAGHEDVARTLKVQAQKLQQLPREMMLAVLEKLYVHDEPIPIDSTRIGNKTIFMMPEDESMYLSAMHVGEKVASEAAKVFYKCNTFLFQPRTMPRIDRKGEEWLDEFFDTDHYKSGVIPRPFVRSMEIHLLQQPDYRAEGEMRAWKFYFGSFPRHDHFEADYDRIIRDYDRVTRYLSRTYGPSAMWTEALGSRQVLSHVLTALPNLRELRIDLDCSAGNEAGLLRLINPAVRRALDKDIKVKMVNSWWMTVKENSPDGSLEVQEQEDLIHYWKQPSDSDYALFRREAQRDVLQISESSDPLDTWWKLKTMAAGKFRHDMTDNDFDIWSNFPHKMAIYRVWLKEHFEVWKWRQANCRLIESFEDMHREIQGVQAETLPDRTRYYIRLLKLMHPGVRG